MGGRNRNRRRHQSSHGAAGAVGGGGMHSAQAFQFNHNSFKQQHKRNRSSMQSGYPGSMAGLTVQHYGKITFGGPMRVSSASQITPERRRQLEAERKKREEYESNFECEVQKSCPATIVKLLKGQDVFKIGKRVTYPMENWGNTCFFNSVMQCFMHTVPLHQFCIMDQSHVKFCSMKNDQQDFQQKTKNSLLLTYMEFVKRTDQSGRPPLKMITQFMKQILPSYMYGQQEDAQEYTLGFIDHLIKSCFNHQNPVQRYVIKHQNETPIYQIFGFKTRSQVFCEQCGHQSNTYTEHCSLTLSIPRRRSSQGFTLQDCMKQFLDVDRLTGENKYSCSCCKKKVNATKSCSIETPPCILIVDFVRYNLGRKNNEIIHYPKRINLKDYMSRQIDLINSQKINTGRSSSRLNKNAADAGIRKQQMMMQGQGSQDYNYELYGIIVHQGSSRQFGHYYSYCRGFENDNTWYKCNDDSITRLSGGADSAMDKQAYMLFYQLIHDPQKQQQIMTNTITEDVGGAVGKIALQKQLFSQQSTACTSQDKKSPVHTLNPQQTLAYDAQMTSGAQGEYGNKTCRNNTESIIKANEGGNRCERQAKKQSIQLKLPFMELGAVPNPHQDHISRRTRRASSSDPQAAAVGPPLHVDTLLNGQMSKNKKASVYAVLRNHEDINGYSKTMVNDDHMLQQVKSILKTKNSKREEKLRAKEQLMQSHRKNGHVEIEINAAEKKKDNVKNGEQRQQTSISFMAGSQTKNDKVANSLKDLLANGIDDDAGIMDFDITDRKQKCDDLIIPVDRQLWQKMDPSPLEMQKNDSRVSMVSKTSMTSSMLARNGFISLKKTLHPVIFTRENKKRKLNALQQLCHFRQQQAGRDKQKSPSQWPKSMYTDLMSPLSNPEKMMRKTEIGAATEVRKVRKEKRGSNGIKKLKKSGL